MWIDDEIIRRCHEPHVLSVWVPSSTMVVLGSSNKADVEVKERSCEEDGIPILKRYGGGGTVVLHPGCVVLSLGLWVSQYYGNDRFFRKINDAVIGTLADTWPGLAELRQDGLSDLAYGERKVAGPSLFRSRNYLLYQASLLVDARVDLMERYLEHPSREPEYRGGKSHRNFVAGLDQFVEALSPHELEKRLLQNLMPRIYQSLNDDLVAANPKQCQHLYKRAGVSLDCSPQESNHMVNARSY